MRNDDTEESNIGQEAPMVITPGDLWRLARKITASGRALVRSARTAASTDTERDG
jgi:hypothetical protein